MGSYVGAEFTGSELPNFIQLSEHSGGPRGSSHFLLQRHLLFSAVDSVLEGSNRLHAKEASELAVTDLVTKCIEADGARGEDFGVEVFEVKSWLGLCFFAEVEDCLFTNLVRDGLAGPTAVADNLVGRVVDR